MDPLAIGFWVVFGAVVLWIVVQTVLSFIPRKFEPRPEGGSGSSSGIGPTGNEVDGDFGDVGDVGGGDSGGGFD